MKKALMYASVASMIQQFNMDNIRLLQELGYQVDVACNFEFGSTISNEKISELKVNLKNNGVRFFHIPVPRKLHDVRNLMDSYKSSVQIMNEEHYDLIHCHSPIGGVICRLANRKSNHYQKCKMIYTAHGFHFFEGNSPIKNLIFKTIERIGARYTDTLITINKEDFEAAGHFTLKKHGNVEYVPGIGLNLDKISPRSEKGEILLDELNLDPNVQLILSVGELNENKNHKVVIEALPKLKDNVHYLICGQGILKGQLLSYADELKVKERVHLLGYRSDTIEIMKSCDIFVFPSKREGLSVALMEAMACGLPCVVSKIRGNTDLIDDGKGGILFDDETMVAQDILQLLESDTVRRTMSMYNLSKIKSFSREEVEKKMRCVYR